MALCSKCHKNVQVKGKTNSWCQPCWNKHQQASRGRSMDEVRSMGDKPPVKQYVPGDPEFDEIAKTVTPLNKIKKEWIYIRSEK